MDAAVIANDLSLVAMFVSINTLIKRKDRQKMIS